MIGPLRPALTLFRSINTFSNVKTQVVGRVFQTYKDSTKIREMSSQELIKAISFACSQGDAEIAVWRAYAKKALQVLSSMDLCQISKIAQSFCTVRIRDQALLDGLANRTIEIMEKNRDENAVDLETAAKILISLSRLQIYNGSLGRVLIGPILTGIVGDNKVLKSRTLLDVLQAFLKLGLKDPRISTGALDRVLANMEDYGPTSIANLWTIITRAEGVNAGQIEKVVSGTYGCWELFSGIDLLNILKALSLNKNSPLIQKKEAFDNEFLLKLIKNLDRRLSCFNLKERISIFRCMVNINFYHENFIHERLLPTILHRLENPQCEKSVDELLLLIALLTRLPSVTELAVECVGISLDLVASQLDYSTAQIISLSQSLFALNTPHRAILLKLQDIILKNRTRARKDFQNTTGSVLMTVFTRAAKQLDTHDFEPVLRILATLPSAVSSGNIQEEISLDKSICDHEMENNKIQKPVKEVRQIFLHSFDVNTRRPHTSEVELNKYSGENNEE